MVKKLIKRHLEVFNNSIERLVFCLFIILFCLEPITIILNEVLNYGLRVKFIYKGILLIVIVVISLIYCKSLWKFLLVIGLIICFIIGQLTLPATFSVFQGDFLNELILGDIYIVAKFVYILVFVAAYETIPNTKNLTDKIIDMFYWFMLINTLVIITGLLANLECFRAYPFSKRFGFIGFIELAGESIHYYTLAISIAYLKYLENKKHSLLLFLLIISGILIGKKAIFIFLLLLLLIHFYYLKKRNLVIMCLGILSILIAFFQFFFETIFLKIFPFWNNLYEEKGLLSVIFSNRNHLFNSTIVYLDNNWRILNYLFGGSDFENYRSEFGFFDLFLAFGITGFIIYISYLYKYILINQESLVKAILISILFIEAISGGLLINVVPSILLFLTAKYFRDNFNKNAEKNISNSNSTSR